VKAKQVLE